MNVAQLQFSPGLSSDRNTTLAFPVVTICDPSLPLPSTPALAARLAAIAGIEL